MISPEIKETVIRVVEEFNLKLSELSFMSRFRENSIYIDSCNQGRVTLFARLEFSESSQEWRSYVYFEELNNFTEQAQIETNPSKVEEVIRDLLQPYLNNLICRHPDKSYGS